MSRYLTAQKTTTRIKAENVDTVKIIIQAIASGYSSCYDWRQTVVYADSLQEIADEMGFYLHECRNGDIIPILNDTYSTNLYRDILTHISPYMEDGFIKVHATDGERFYISFRNGKARKRRVSR